MTSTEGLTATCAAALGLPNLISRTVTITIAILEAATSVISVTNLVYKRVSKNNGPEDQRPNFLDDIPIFRLVYYVAFVSVTNNNFRGVY